MQEMGDKNTNTTSTCSSSNLIAKMKLNVSSSSLSGQIISEGQEKKPASEESQQEQRKCEKRNAEDSPAAMAVTKRNKLATTPDDIASSSAADAIISSPTTDDNDGMMVLDAAGQEDDDDDDDEEEEEDDDDLTKVWRKQTRQRRKGEWAPTGGWTPPKWAPCCQRKYPPPGAIVVEPPPHCSLQHPLQSCTTSNDTGKEDESSISAQGSKKSSRTSAFSCGKKLLVRVIDLLQTNILPSFKMDGRKSTICSSETGNTLYGCESNQTSSTTNLCSRSHGGLKNVQVRNTTAESEGSTMKQQEGDPVVVVANYSTTIKSFADVKYPAYTKPTDELLVRAHKTLETLLPKGDCDSLDVVRLARQYYDHWRPDPGKTRVILLSESFASTSIDCALSLGLDPNMLAGEYNGPRSFISLVYCLAYGENEALVTTTRPINGVNHKDFASKNKGTPQFWTLLAACSRGTKAEAKSPKPKSGKYAFAADVLKCGGLKMEDRLSAKCAILEDLRKRGIWLLDASIIGWYITQPQKFRRSKKTNEVHRIARERPPKSLKAPSLILSWEMFLKHVIRDVAEEGALRLLIPIGKEVEACLTRERLEEAVSPQSVAASSSNNCSLPNHGSSSTHVTESFPAPNAWIPGGYGPYFTKLSRIVNEVAPPLESE